MIKAADDDKPFDVERFSESLESLLMPESRLGTPESLIEAAAKTSLLFAGVSGIIAGAVGLDERDATRLKHALILHAEAMSDDLIQNKRREEQSK